jgi:hypothetical protein
MCENFFATLEGELLDRRRFKTQLEAIDYERAYGAQLNFPCGDQQPLKESAPPPPAASGKNRRSTRPHLN